MLKVYISCTRWRNKELYRYDSPYEAPDNPELFIDTEIESLEESAAKVIDFLKSKEIIT